MITLFKRKKPSGYCPKLIKLSIGDLVRTKEVTVSFLNKKKKLLPCHVKYHRIGTSPGSKLQSGVLFFGKTPAAG